MRNGDLHGCVEITKKIDGQSDGHGVVLDQFNATPEEKEGLITVLRGFMENFVDRAFGIDPVQRAAARTNVGFCPVAPTICPPSRRPRGGARPRTPHVNRVLT